MRGKVNGYAVAKNAWATNSSASFYSKGCIHSKYFDWSHLSNGHIYTFNSRNIQEVCTKTCVSTFKNIRKHFHSGTLLNVWVTALGATKSRQRHAITQTNLFRSVLASFVSIIGPFWIFIIFCVKSLCHVDYSARFVSSSKYIFNLLRFLNFVFSWHLDGRILEKCILTTTTGRKHLSRAHLTATFTFSH